MRLQPECVVSEDSKTSMDSKKPASNPDMPEELNGNGTQVENGNGAVEEKEIPNGNGASCDTDSPSHIKLEKDDDGASCDTDSPSHIEPEKDDDCVKPNDQDDEAETISQPDEVKTEPVPSPSCNENVSSRGASPETTKTVIKNENDSESQSVTISDDEADKNDSEKLDADEQKLDNEASPVKVKESPKNSDNEDETVTSPRRSTRRTSRQGADEEKNEETELSPRRVTRASRQQDAAAAESEKSKSEEGKSDDTPKNNEPPADTDDLEKVKQGGLVLKLDSGEEFSVQLADDDEEEEAKSHCGRKTPVSDSDDDVRVLKVEQKPKPRTDVRVTCAPGSNTLSAPVGAQTNLLRPALNTTLVNTSVPNIVLTGSLPTAPMISGINPNIFVPVQYPSTSNLKPGQLNVLLTGNTQIRAPTSTVQLTAAKPVTSSTLAPKVITPTIDPAAAAAYVRAQEQHKKKCEEYDKLSEFLSSMRNKITAKTVVEALRDHVKLTPGLAPVRAVEKLSKSGKTSPVSDASEAKTTDSDATSKDDEKTEVSEDVEMKAVDSEATDVEMQEEERKEGDGSETDEQEAKKDGSVTPEPMDEADEKSETVEAETPADKEMEQVSEKGSEDETEDESKNEKEVDKEKGDSEDKTADQDETDEKSKTVEADTSADKETERASEKGSEEETEDEGKNENEVDKEKGDSEDKTTADQGEADADSGTKVVEEKVASGDEKEEVQPTVVKDEKESSEKKDADEAKPEEKKLMDPNQPVDKEQHEEAAKKLRPVARFLYYSGLDLAREYIYKDLMDSQEKLLDKKKLTHEEEIDFHKIKRLYYSYKRRNRPLHPKTKKCGSCNFQTESASAMYLHHEYGHFDYTAGRFECALCKFDTRAVSAFKFHMEADHNMNGRSTGKPAYWHCDLCPFENNSKPAVVKHKVKCTKRFDIKKHLFPTYDDINFLFRALPGQAIGPNPTSTPPAPPKPKPFVPKVTTYNPVQSAASSQTQPQVVTYMTANGPVRVQLNPAPRPAAPMPIASRPMLLKHLANSTTSTSIVRQPPPNVSLKRPATQPPANIPPTKVAKSELEICEICGGFIKDRGSLRMHFKMAHCIDLDESVLNSKQTAPLNCDVCHKRFWTFQGLTMHRVAMNHIPKSNVKTSLGSKCFICSVFVADISKHINTVHNMIPGQLNTILICPVCGNQVSHGGLMSHLKLLHNMILPSPKMSVNNSSNATQPQPTPKPQLTPKPQPTTANKVYTCHSCKRTFVTILALNAHIESAHSYRCPFCDYRCSSLEAYKIHQAKGHKKFNRRCILCKKLFPSHTFTEHVKSNHLRKCSIKVKRCDHLIPKKSKDKKEKPTPSSDGETEKEVIDVTDD